MNRKRFLLAVLAVFVAQAIVGGLLQSLWMDSVFDDASFFRPEGDEHLLIYFASRIVFDLVFVYLFARVAEGRGLARALRYGLVIWLFYSVPMTIGFWAFIKMPNALAMAWIGIGLVEMVVGAMVAAAIYRRAVGAPAR